MLGKAYEVAVESSGDLMHSTVFIANKTVLYT